MKIASQALPFLFYAYVDDFIFGGNDKQHTLSQIAAFRALASTTDPEKNYCSLLGIEIERDKDRRLSKVTMAKRIEELADTFPQSKYHRRTVPIPTSGYLVSDAVFDHLPPRAAVLTDKRQVHIITTTAIKSVSDGGQVSIYRTSVQGLDCLQDVVIYTAHFYSIH